MALGDRKKLQQNPTPKQVKKNATNGILETKKVGNPPSLQVISCIELLIVISYLFFKICNKRTCCGGVRMVLFIRKTDFARDCRF